MDPPSFDVAWRKRALAGEAGAIQQLANQMIQPLYRFCFYRVGRNGHLCEEVVRETLLRAIRETPRYLRDK